VATLSRAEYLKMAGKKKGKQTEKTVHVHTVLKKKSKKKKRKSKVVDKLVKTAYSKTNLAALRAISSPNMREEMRNLICETMSDKEVCAARCICHNFLVGNIPYKKGELKKLRRFKKSIEILADKNTSASQARKLLSQKGGIFPLLAPLLAKAAVPILGGAVAQMLGPIMGGGN